MWINKKGKKKFLDEEREARPSLWLIGEKAVSSPKRS